MNDPQYAMTDQTRATPAAALNQLPALTQLGQWADFTEAVHAAHIDTNSLRIINAAGIALDVSAQRSSPGLNKASAALLHTRQFTAMRERLLEGGEANPTEGRAARHIALRAPAPDHIIAAERQRANDFVRQADSERRWRNIIHIGIGGSDWGVRLAVRAFGYTGMWRRVNFVANIDGHAIEGGLSGLDPRETLIILASKAFTTAETLENGLRAIEWLKSAGIAEPHKQVVAVTASPERARAWGIPDEHIFRLWDWVGGRFSLWSAVSLTTALAVSSDVVAGMQSGAAAMDAHFVDAPIEENAPVQMAISGIVNRSVLGYGSLNIAPYDFRLAKLVPYIQQLEMESLGKSVILDGSPVDVPTGPAVWGMPGTDAQHTFFQWLHQSSDGAPVDFIVCQHADHGWAGHHQSLLANCLAQREALLRGKSFDTALRETLAEGVEPERARWLARHRTHPGGRPSNLIVLSRLSPYTLGALLALYEHKVFVQAVIWGINPFDQWGVEYGKSLAKHITQSLGGTRPVSPDHDISTAHWVNTFKSSFERPQS